MAALVRDCKHTGVSDDQLQSEQHVLCDFCGGDNCQAKHGVGFALDVLSEDFPELSDEISWNFPQFASLIRKAALTADPVDVFTRVMANNNLLSSSPREIMQRTEATMALVLRLASLGHFVLREAAFMEWNEAAFAEKRLASLAKRGNNPAPGWQERVTGFMTSDVLPLVALSELVLPEKVNLQSQVSLNLKNFEASSQAFPRRSSQLRSSAPASVIIEV